MAGFSYELGDAAAPRGHAFVVFRSERGEPGVWVSYLVVLPVEVDFAKYMPPMLASMMPMGQMSGMGSGTAVPMPPVPERMESMAAVRRLAMARGDDLLDAGTIDVTAIDRLALATHEAAERYHDAYASHMRTFPATPAVTVEVRPHLEDDLAPYRGLNEGDLLGELSKLVGKLRYALSGQDRPLADEARQQIVALGSLLSPKYRLDELLAAAQQEGERGDRLTTLCLDRCYKIHREEYEALPAIEGQIREMRGEPLS